MKIVIDIDEDYYEIIKHDVKVNHNDFKPYNIIANGKPLPKGHGDLIDVNDLEDFCQTHKVGTSAFDGELIYDAGSTSRGDAIWKPLLGELKPIIEAESEETE